MDRLQESKGFLPGIFRSKKRSSGTGGSSNEKKLNPGTWSLVTRVPSGPRNHFIAMAGEFVGTFMFLFFAFAGTQVANTPQTSTGDQSTSIPQGPNPIALLYISLCFAFSLAVNAWIFFRVSGGLFNPAVTLALCLVGAVPFGRGCFVFIAQMFGAMASAGVVKALFPGPLAVTTSLAGGTNTAQGLFIEMFLTAQLVFTILMLAVEKHKGTFLAPVGIGLSLFIAELGGVYYTGGSLNPARSFGPCVANVQFPSEHWIYWVGPGLGACLAASFYWFIKGIEFQTANPGQDFDDLEANAFDPTTDLSRPVVSPNAVVDRSTTQDLAALNSNDGRTSTSPERERRTASFEEKFRADRSQDGRSGDGRPRSSLTIGNHMSATTPRKDEPPKM